MLSVYENDNVVGLIILSHKGQTESVVLAGGSSTETRRQILDLVASKGDGIWKDEELSDALKSISEEIRQLDLGSVTKRINSARQQIITAIYQTLGSALDAALAKANVPGLSYEISDTQSPYDDSVLIRFSVKEPQHFKFWKSLDHPNKDPWQLHLVPHYHPVMNGWQSAGSLNGDTDAFITGETIRGIRCPKDARRGSVRYSFGSWDKTKHPFYASGNSVEIQIMSLRIISAEGVNQLASVLRASLELDNEYISIIGGFSAPLPSPNNRLLQLKRQSPRQGQDDPRPRGSEADCVWAHRILTQEGCIDRASIPDWFYKENWLEIYATAES